MELQNNVAKSNSKSFTSKRFVSVLFENFLLICAFCLTKWL